MNRFGWISVFVTSIADRKTPSNEENSVWEQAHRVFREQIQATNKNNNLS